MAFDRNKFLRVAAMLGSPYDGERHAAADLAYAMLQAVGMVWSDVLNDPVAAEACRQLLADLEAAHARIAELERQLPDWQPVSRVEIGNHRRVSAWLLDLNSRGEVWFSEREREFIGSCGRWIGPLRPKMREWLQEICNRTAQRYGLVPPV